MRNFGEIVNAVGKDMGLDFNRDGGLLNEDDIKRFVNLGLRQLAQRITKLREDYFLTYVEIDFDGSNNEFNLPSNVLINKIRKVDYYNNGCYFDIPRVDLDKYSQYIGTYSSSSSIPTGYFLIQNPIPTPAEGETAETPSVRETKLILLPPEPLTSVQSLRIYYLRNVTEMVNNSDVPEIPFSQDYLYYYAKWNVAVTDPSKAVTTDLHYKAWDEALKNLLETYADKAPQDGGMMFDIMPEQRLVGIQMGDL